eukprot:TRINITY_DN2058_c0_g1_i2.p1 TRINITY_DN2058_c0_g1~~TRINITY_DN2058_c0_g1_i2.p1  ORF type:complete len:217 (+),score=45.81 TRINITY_DN2058_c0_g1_i2:81-653(+)
MSPLSVKCVPVKVASGNIPTERHPGSIGGRSDIPDVKSIQFIEGKPPVRQSSGGRDDACGMLWCATRSGPKVVCCFGVADTQNPKSQETSPVDLVFQYRGLLRRAADGITQTYVLTSNLPSSTLGVLDSQQQLLISQVSATSTGFTIYYKNGTEEAFFAENPAEWLSRFKMVINPENLSLVPSPTTIRKT